MRMRTRSGSSREHRTNDITLSNWLIIIAISICMCIYIYIYDNSYNNNNNVSIIIAMMIVILIAIAAQRNPCPARCFGWRMTTQPTPTQPTPLAGASETASWCYYH